MTDMPTLVDVMNDGEIVQKIRVATLLVTAQYRATGRKLGPKDIDVPTADEVERRLRKLVDNAIAAYNSIVEVAPHNAEDITGTEEDNLFSVTVVGLPDGGLDLRITQRLV
jgi:hypothetical protein